MKKILLITLLSFNAYGVTKVVDAWDSKALVAWRGLQSFAFDRGGSRYSISERPSYNNPDSRQIKIFDMETGECINSCEQLGVTDLAFHPTDRNKIALTTKNSVVLFDITQNRQTATIKANPNSSVLGLYSLAFNNDGSQIAAGCCGQGKSIFLFDVRQEKCVKFKPTLSQIYGITFLANGNVESTGSDALAYRTKWDIRANRANHFEVKDDFLHVSYAQGNLEKTLLKQRCNSNENNDTLSIVTESAEDMIIVDGKYFITSSGSVALSSDANSILCLAKDPKDNTEKVHLLKRTVS